MSRAAAEGKPHSAHAETLNFEQTWMREPQLQCDEEVAIYDEIFPYTLQGIDELIADKPVIAEGAGFMPRLMLRERIVKSRYICVAPTEAFQRREYAKREWIGQFLAGCRKPETAFDNWMSRDALFAQHVLTEAQALGYATLVVDGSRSLDENYAAVKLHFGL